MTTGWCFLLLITSGIISSNTKNTSLFFPGLHSSILLQISFISVEYSVKALSFFKYFLPTSYHLLIRSWLLGIRILDIQINRCKLLTSQDQVHIFPCICCKRFQIYLPVIMYHCVPKDHNTNLKFCISNCSPMIFACLFSESGTSSILKLL